MARARRTSRARRPLELSVVRYPGGNFVSGYHWQDGVGPREARPTLRELAWQSIEPNHVGTDEFLSLCHKLGWQPMLAVNLGTGTPEEARNLVEYCNSPGGTKYADMRVANGSSGPAMNTYLEWDRTVLEILGELADYVSLHRYVGNRSEDMLDFLAVTNTIDRQIEDVDAVCRYVQSRTRSRKRTYLCFDEWNVWYKTFDRSHMDGAGRFAPHLVEELFNLEDALVVAGFLNCFIRHADCVKVANLAQLVNIIAPILTRGDDILIQSIYWPLLMYSRRRSGQSLRVQVDGPSYEGTRHGEATYIDASAILDDDRLSVFATNRSPHEPAELTVDVADRRIATLKSAELLTGPGAKAANCWSEPNAVSSADYDDVRLADGRATTELPPLSPVALTLGLD